MQHMDQTPAGWVLTFGGSSCRPGPTVLDMATGTAMSRWRWPAGLALSPGSTMCPPCRERRAPRAGAENLQAEFEEADAEELLCADASSDYPSSAIEVMLTAQYQWAADELLRVGSSWSRSRRKRDKRARTTLVKRSRRRC
jgi:ubiquinone/menaquinone biosynthesis C-methylase UbiE